MTDYPGKELPKFWREIAAALVDCQGFGYEYAGRHPALIAPSGLRAQLPSTVTDGSRGHRLSYLTALKRIGA